MINGTEKGLCNQPFCRNRRRKDRHRCHKCERRRVRAANPMRAAFRQLKDSARRRHIVFHLHFEQFRRFALQTDYLNRKGNNGHCLTVDRIDNRKGYFKWNIQPLTRSENSIKRAKWDAIRMKQGFSWESNA